MKEKDKKSRLSMNKLLQKCYKNVNIWLGLVTSQSLIKGYCIVYCLNSTKFWNINRERAEISENIEKTF